MRARPFRALASLALSLSMLAPQVALAAATQDPTDEARELYEEGRARFDLLDYGAAIELWTKAYGVLPSDDESTREVRNLLVYNIATAQEKSFDMDGDVTHLRAARGLLQKYLDEFKTLKSPTEENREEFKKVRARIAEIDARIETATAGTAVGGTAAPAPNQPSPAQLEKQKQREKKAEIQKILAEDPVLAKEYKSGQKLVIAGAVVLGVGGLTILAGASLFSYTANTGASLGVMGAGVLIAVPGAVLLPIGLKRKRTARYEAGKRVTFVPTPITMRRGFGLGVSGRF